MAARKRKPTKKRPAKINRKQFTLSGHHGKGDLVSIQISARLHRVPKGMKITKRLLADMVRHKAETSTGYWDAGIKGCVGCVEGDDPPGIKLKIVRWKNPGRRSAGDRGWRTGPQSEAWGTLRLPILSAIVAV